MALYRRSEAVANSERERRDALWGQVTCATELELTESRDLLSSLTAGPEFGDPREIVRAAGGELSYRMKFGPIASSNAEIAVELVDSVTDALIRTSFRNSYAHSLALSAHYREAADVVEVLLQDIARSRLDFAEPYALVSGAIASAGMRNWDHAHGQLDRALAAAKASQNAFAEQMCYAARVRVLAQVGKHRSALALEVPSLYGAIPSMRAEVLLARSVVLATVGRIEEAVALVNDVRGTTAAIEAVVLRSAIDAVIALRRRDQSYAERVSAFEVTAFDSGALDLLVMAYRACPELLSMLLRESRDPDRLHALIARVGDLDLARAVGHPVILSDADLRARLTRRENEVYELLREGLSNRQIADLLVISEATARLHTHHVYDKIGTRSRTAIAIQAALERADQATSATGDSSESD